MKSILAVAMMALILPAAVTGAQEDPAARREAAFWEKIKETDDRALFEAYMAEVKAGLFPGAYVDEARARLEALAEPETAPKPDDDGFITRESGLRYKVVEAGDGERPKAGDMVRVHYEGRLADGTVFDSSYRRDTPAVFSLNGVIRGWQEALLMMPEGAKWELEIPSYLAYGKKGTDAIPPDATLFFTVELIKITFSPTR